MLHVYYARDMWLTKGLRIRIRLVVLSNFHVQNIFIRVTVYFILIFKVYTFPKIILIRIKSRKYCCHLVLL